MGIPLNDTMDWYAHANIASTDGRYRFFYRNPGHSSIQALRDLGFEGLTAGYTPYLDGEQEDYSAVTGVKGDMGSLFFDVSGGIGHNILNYYLNNTLNPSLGLVNGEPPQRDFRNGGYEQKELNLNADFSTAVSDAMNLAFGMEWRKETYIVNAGESASYIGSGSNGLAGFRPQDSGEFDRDNWAIYADIEHDLTDDFMLQYALRYEDFSDFGGTMNGKLAGRYRLSDTTNLRAAVSTGFHAPTPGQANVRTTITTFDGATGLQVEEGLVPPTSAAALAVGGAPLKEENSVSVSFGMTSDISDNTTITLDFFNIKVDDRIYRTGDIAVPGVEGASISFYTNALNMRSRGVDLVINSSMDWSSTTYTDVTFAANYNKVKILGQTPVGSILPVSASTIEDIENNYPNLRFVLTANTHIGDDWNFMVRANYYGSHYDERGTIGASSNPSAEIGATIYVAVELGYQVTPELRIVGGLTNALIFTIVL